MERKCKTEITIETNRTYLIRTRRNPARTSCAKCLETSRMLPPEEIVAMSGISARAIYRAVEAGEAHFAETIEGCLLVCLKSLGIGENIIKADSSASVPFPNSVGEISEEEIQDRFFYADQQPLAYAAITVAALESENDARPPARKRDWSLTEDALERLLNCLDADRESAGQKYESIRRKLIKYFQCRGCLFPEEIADETINRVARRISEGKEIWTNDPANYFFGVAHNVLREYWGSPEREFAPIECLQPAKLSYEDTLKPEGSGYDSWLKEKRFEILDEFIQKLSHENREMIIRYYQGEKGDKIRNRKELAKRLGIPQNTLRIRVFRIRERLEKMVRARLDLMIAAGDGGSPQKLMRNYSAP